MLWTYILCFFYIYFQSSLKQFFLNLDWNVDETHKVVDLCSWRGLIFLPSSDEMRSVDSHSGWHYNIFEWEGGTVNRVPPCVVVSSRCTLVTTIWDEQDILSRQCKTILYLGKRGVGGKWWCCVISFVLGSGVKGIISSFVLFLVVRIFWLIYFFTTSCCDFVWWNVLQWKYVVVWRCPWEDCDRIFLKWDDILFEVMIFCDRNWRNISVALSGELYYGED